jgi:uracil-DNA glycosylase
MSNHLPTLINSIRDCTHCAQGLPLGPKPVLQAEASARLRIIGQAPGTKVHATGIPWNDASGKRLREWLGLGPDVFYDPSHVAITPMGFCYPGRGKGGDLPPRPECAKLWHDKLMAVLPEIRLTLLIGHYAHAYYLGSTRKATLTDTVRHWKEYVPNGYFPLVHPSPRNQLWLKKNPWFEGELVPRLQEKIRELELTSHLVCITGEKNL